MSRLTPFRPTGRRSTIMSDVATELRHLLRLAAPLALTYLAGIAINTTDILMMGWLGPRQLAAGSLAGNYYALFLFFGIGIAAAVSPIAAQALGGRRPEEMPGIVRDGFWAVLAVSLAAWVGLWYTDGFLRLIGQPDSLARLGAQYVHAAMWGLLPALCYAVLRNVMAAHNATVPALVVSCVGIVVNALSNYALMFGKFGFPALGLVGAGLSSTVVNTLMFAALFGYMAIVPRFRRLRLFARLWRLRLPGVRVLYALGTPIGMSNLGEMGAFVASTFLVGLFGTTQVAAHAIALQISGIVYMVSVGLGHAATVRVGYLTGAGSRPAAVLAGWCALGFGLGFSLLSALMLWLLAAPIVGLFLDPDAAGADRVLQVAVTFVGVVALFQVVDSPATVGAGALRGFKDTRVPMAIILFGYWALGAPLAGLMSYGLDFQGLGVWWGLAASLAIVSSLMIWRFRTMTGGERRLAPA